MVGERGKVEEEENVGEDDLCIGITSLWNY